MRAGKQPAAEAASRGAAGKPVVLIGSAARLWRPSWRHSRRQRQINIARLGVILSLFLALLAAALLAGGGGFLEALLSGSPDEREAREIGDIVYALPDGISCRHWTFDNSSAELTANGIARCAGDAVKGSRRFTWNAR